MEKGKYNKKEMSSLVKSQIVGEIARVKTVTGMKDYQIAEKMGLTKSNYSEVIRNRLGQVARVEEIANAMGYDLEIKFVKRVGE